MFDQRTTLLICFCPLPGLPVPVLMEPAGILARHPQLRSVLHPGILSLSWWHWSCQALPVLGVVQGTTLLLLSTRASEITDWVLVHWRLEGALQ